MEPDLQLFNFAHNTHQQNYHQSTPISQYFLIISFPSQHTNPSVLVVASTKQRKARDCTSNSLKLREEKQVLIEYTYSNTIGLSTASTRFSRPKVYV